MSSDIELAWNLCESADWDALLERAPFAPLQQAWGYGAAIAETRRCQVQRCVVFHGGRVRALAQTFERDVGPLTIVRILRGPVWLDPQPDPSERNAILSALRRAFALRRGRVLVWTPELPNTSETHSALRDCGLRRMVTGYSTLLLDLDKPAETLRRELHGKWRNMLRSAEKVDLSLRVTATGRPFEWLVRQADGQRRQSGYLAPSAAMIRATAAAMTRKTDVLTVTAASAPGRERIAGTLFFVHGKSATYEMGWSGADGRRYRAHHALLWRGIETLQKRGVRWLDLGGLDVVSSPGVARFKLGLGGRLHTLAGTYM